MLKTRNKETNFLSFVPSISEKIDFSVVGRNVVIARRNSGFFFFVFQTIFNKPLFSYIYLDDIGSAIFLAIDGKKDVSTLFDIVNHHFCGKAVNVVSFCSYIKTLSSCGIIKLKYPS